MATPEQVSVLLNPINLSLNINNSLPIEIHPHDSPIWIFAAPLLIIIGCVENILALVVLSRSQFCNIPSRTTLISLAVIDSLVLFFGLIRFWINVVFETQPSEWGDAWCKGISWIVITLSHLSSCLVALLSVERLFAVCLPNHQFKPSVDSGGSIVLIILCGSINTIHFKLTHLVQNLPPSSENVTIPEPGIHTKLHTYICTNGTVEIALLIDILDMLFLFGLPFLTIVLCNFCIIYKLKKRLKITKRNRYLSVKKDSELNLKKSVLVDLAQTTHQCTVEFKTSRSQISRAEQTDLCKKSHENPFRRKLDKTYSERRQTRITITLLIVTFAFLLCNLPFCLIHILRTADESRQTPAWNMAWLLSYLLVYVNNCINFPIYIISQPPFRSELRQILSFCKSQ